MKGVKVYTHGMHEIMDRVELSDVQSAVGGYIEIVRLNVEPFEYNGNKIYDLMIVNEDGFRLQLDINLIATEMYRKNTHPNTNVIVGDVVFTSSRWFD